MERWEYMYIVTALIFYVCTYICMHDDVCAYVVCLMCVMHIQPSLSNYIILAFLVGGNVLGPRISVDRPQKATHRFGVGGIYCSCYILISSGIWAGQGSEIWTDRISLSGDQLTATAALSCCQREKKHIGNAIRSGRWPFSRWLITHVDARSVRNSKNWRSTFLSLKRRALYRICYYNNSLRTASFKNIKKFSNNVPTRCIRRNANYITAYGNPKLFNSISRTVICMYICMLWYVWHLFT
jgi:hypothetical protein